MKNNTKYYNDAEIDKSLIFAFIFLCLMIYGLYTFLQFFYPIGLVGIIIPFIGFIFHVNNAFSNGFEMKILSIEIKTANDFFEYIAFNLIFSTMFGIVIAYIMYHFNI